MATIFRKSGSLFWWVAFFTADGKRRYLSTKKRSKPEAIVVGAEWEKRARKALPGDDEKRQRLLRLLENAADLALKGTLSEASAQGILSQMMEVSTGESLRQVSIADWMRGWVAEKKGSKSNGTYVRYEGVIESFLTSLPAGKMNQPLAALAVSDIRQFRDSLISGGRAAATANVAVKILRGHRGHRGRRLHCHRRWHRHPHPFHLPAANRARHRQRRHHPDRRRHRSGPNSIYLVNCCCRAVEGHR